ncbi:MAG: ACP phosphodiesterase [Weeksellaceae bacterium]|nr:ACP phosphodiesterase [Weeksellaceae bacterium]
MNFVAHQYLSFDDAGLQLGNHLGEVVKGKKYLEYAPEVQRGILLHRYIDSYTDAHPVTRRSVSLIRSDYGKFSGILIDIFYDFFLIKDWSKFSTQPFEEFKRDRYAFFEAEMPNFPPKLKFLTQFLISQDWFDRYSTMEGVELTLRNLSLKTKFENRMHEASKALYKNEKKLHQDFLQFFPQLIEFCEGKIHELKQEIEDVNRLPEG